MSKDAIFHGGSHSSGNDIPVTVVDTGEKIRVEGDEYLICGSFIRESGSKIFEFENKTNLEILRSLNAKASCDFDQNRLSSGDFIICKMAVKDPKKRTIKGTVQSVLNQIQKVHGCNVSYSGATKELGGFVSQDSYKNRHGGFIRPKSDSITVEDAVFSGGGEVNEEEVNRKYNRGDEVLLKNNAVEIIDKINKTQSGLYITLGLEKYVGQIFRLGHCGDDYVNILISSSKNQFGGDDSWSVPLEAVEIYDAQREEMLDLESELKNGGQINKHGGFIKREKRNTQGGYDYTGQEQERAKKVDLVKLPKDIKGTNCANCSFVKVLDSKKGLGFCVHKKIQLPVTSRMTCALWDSEKAERSFKDGGQVDAKLNSQHGYDYFGKDNETAKKVDLLTLPKHIEGTNCFNCSFVNKGFCNNKDVKLPVTERMCCALWTAKGVSRSWESSHSSDDASFSEKKLSDGGEVTKYKVGQKVRIKNNLKETLQEWNKQHSHIHPYSLEHGSALAGQEKEIKEIHKALNQDIIVVESHGLKYGFPVQSIEPYYDQRSEMLDLEKELADGGTVSEKSALKIGDKVKIKSLPEKDDLYSADNWRLRKDFANEHKNDVFTIVEYNQSSQRFRLDGNGSYWAPEYLEKYDTQREEMYDLEKELKNGGQINKNTANEKTQIILGKQEGSNGGNRENANTFISTNSRADSEIGRNKYLEQGRRVQEFGNSAEFKDGGEVLKNRENKKREKIKNLAENLRSLKINNTKALSSSDEKEAITALVIAIMFKSAERVGNEESASNGHVGITGLRKKNVIIKGNTIHLNYTGKSGVKHEKSFTDAEIAKYLKKATKNSPNHKIFTTSDKFKIKNDRINRILSEYNVTSKDIRAHQANKMVIEKLKKIAPEKEESKRKKQFIKIAKSVAAKVGHSSNMLRNSYLAPEVESNWIKNGRVTEIRDFADGGVIDASFSGKSQHEYKIGEKIRLRENALEIIRKFDESHSSIDIERFIDSIRYENFVKNHEGKIMKVVDSFNTHSDLYFLNIVDINREAALISVPAIAIEPYDEAREEMLDIEKELKNGGKIMDITDKIKTYEDACKELGIKDITENLSVFVAGNYETSKFIIATYKLSIIAKALNQGWSPDWSNDSEYKYIPYFEWDGKGCGFSFYSVARRNTSTFAASGLYFSSEKLAKYAATQFFDLYCDYLKMPQENAREIMNELEQEMKNGGKIAEKKSENCTFEDIENEIYRFKYEHKNPELVHSLDVLTALKRANC